MVKQRREPLLSTPQNVIIHNVDTTEQKRLRVAEVTELKKLKVRCYLCQMIQLNLTIMINIMICALRKQPFLLEGIEQNNLN